MRTKQVECIVFRRKEHVEFLLLKRIPEKGGFWQPPCGGVESEDESLLEAAHREMREETGIQKENIISTFEDVYQFTMHNDYLTGKKTKALTEYVLGFEVEPDTKITIENNIYPEHEEYQWVAFAQAITLLKWNDNKEAFKALHEIISNKNS